MAAGLLNPCGQSGVSPHLLGCPKRSTSPNSATINNAENMTIVSTKRLPAALCVPNESFRQTTA
jgi:hypothetical protein